MIVGAFLFLLTLTQFRKGLIYGRFDFIDHPLFFCTFN